MPGPASSVLKPFGAPSTPLSATPREPAMASVRPSGLNATASTVPWNTEREPRVAPASPNARYPVARCRCDKRAFRAENRVPNIPSRKHDGSSPRRPHSCDPVLVSCDADPPVFLHIGTADRLLLMSENAQLRSRTRIPDPCGSVFAVRENAPAAPYLKTAPRTSPSWPARTATCRPRSSLPYDGLSIPARGDDIQTLGTELDGVQRLRVSGQDRLESTAFGRDVPDPSGAV